MVPHKYPCFILGDELKINFKTFTLYFLISRVALNPSDLLSETVLPLSYLLTPLSFPPPYYLQSHTCLLDLLEISPCILREAEFQIVYPSPVRPATQMVHRSSKTNLVFSLPTISSACASQIHAHHNYAFHSQVGMSGVSLHALSSSSLSVQLSYSHMTNMSQCLLVFCQSACLNHHHLVSKQEKLPNFSLQHDSWTLSNNPFSLPYHFRKQIMSPLALTRTSISFHRTQDGLSIPNQAMKSLHCPITPSATLLPLPYSHVPSCQMPQPKDLFPT